MSSPTHTEAAMMPSEIVAKIYDGLDPDARAVARDAVKHIAGIHQQFVADIVEIGSTLLRVKEAVGHGNFGPWIKAEFDWTERTAQNFMAVAERFGANPKCVSHLPLATVYRLAAPSTPDELREKIVTRLEGGETVGSDEIADEITTARREAQRERELAKKSPEARRRAVASRERQEAERQRAVAQIKVERARCEANRAEAADLIVNGLGNFDLDRLLELLKDGYLAHRDLIEARERANDLPDEVDIPDSERPQ